MSNHRTLRALLLKNRFVTLLEGIAAAESGTNRHARGRHGRRRDRFPVHDRPPSHQKRIDSRALVGHPPTCFPALSCVCRCRWSIVALFGTMGPENKNERLRGRSNLSAASPPTLAQKETPIQNTESPCPSDPFPIRYSYLLRRGIPGRLPKDP